MKQPPGHSVGSQRDGSALDGADAASGRHQPCQCFLFFSDCWTGVGCLMLPTKASAAAVFSCLQGFATQGPEAAAQTLAILCSTILILRNASLIELNP